MNKKVVLAGSLANFLSRIKVPRGKTDFGGPFLSRKSRKMHALSLLCYAKNRCLSNFCVLLFCRQNLLQKSREDKPRSCFAKFACSNQVTSKRPPTVSSLLLYRCCYYGGTSPRSACSVAGAAASGSYHCSSLSGTSGRLLGPRRGELQAASSTSGD